MLEFAADTFGSGHGLWDTPDVLRFDPGSRELVGADFQLPYLSASSETSDRLPTLPAVHRAGLRADGVWDFRRRSSSSAGRSSAGASPTPRAT
ncbi:hypothetical protein ACFVW2_24520 [Streptomyces sp. NPDC058171]